LEQKELRQIDVESVEVRELGEDNQYVIEGYVAKFNSRSRFMGFYEEIKDGAFNRTLADGHNIFSMFAHDSDKILGSTKSGSLTLSVDSIGLRFTLRINPEVSYAKDVYHLVKDGDVDGCSFGFIARDDEWSMLEDGTEIRYLKDIELIECTITPFPAYMASEATCRSYDEYKEERNHIQKQKELRKRLILKTFL
jgi:HK97 family phage prohead protease